MVLSCYAFSCRHRSEEEEEVDGPTGTIRINGSQIETKIEYATVSLGLSTNVEGVLKEAVKQFAAQVTNQI
jgi:C4-type Zn-finger protein